MPTFNLHPSRGFPDDGLKFVINAEKWRFISYVCFWGMCIFAICVTKFVAGPMILKGPTAYGRPEGDICGPFNRVWPEGGVELGRGYDIKTQGHLKQLFGYGNICSYWDYSPARELTAMVYPVFEYSLIIYVILDFCTIAIANKRRGLPGWFCFFSKVIFPINLILCSQFRMIFVCLAYENLQQHTAGFLGFQYALILVSVQNSLYIYYTNIAYDFLGGIKNTRLAVLTYQIGLFVVSAFKIVGTTFIVLEGKGAPWALADSGIGEMKVGQAVDLVWMVFNAVIPLFISYIRWHNEDPLIIDIYSSKPFYLDDVDETLGLTGGGRVAMKVTAEYEKVR